ncbi:MAG: glutathionylspermidine synthase family protein [Phycisphaerales bacterium]|nr:glutathionylspermidine synthase family protein [Phycisphaerales bacterium]
MPWHISSAIPEAAFATVRRKAIFECCKWDVQVEDTATLCPFPLVLRREAWDELLALAERLAAETLEAERELLRRPQNQEQLGLPKPILKALRKLACAEEPRGGARIMRFDFHWTMEGWRVSEVNSDVPGGLNEASGFSRLMAAQTIGASLELDPAAEYADALSRHLRENDLIGLVHATAYSDDRQVMEFLARALLERGLRTRLMSPEHVQWHSGVAYVGDPDLVERLALIVRFFPAEWLPELPRRTGWQHFFAGSQTTLSNPATALLTQSKRFPLSWNSLNTDVPTWRRLLPETCDPRHVDWRDDSRWVLKPALGRVGDGIGLRGVTPAKQWEQIRRAVRRHPAHWVAQRRFDPVRVVVGAEGFFPCIGIYTIDGRAAGAYGRIATNGLIDFRARDIAVLVESPVAIAAI